MQYFVRVLNFEKLNDSTNLKTDQYRITIVFFTPYSLLTILANIIILTIVAPEYHLSGL